MNTLDKDIKELQTRLKGGSIQWAYKGIVSYMSRLRTVFANQRIERVVFRDIPGLIRYDLLRVIP